MFQCCDCGLPQYGRNDRKSRVCVNCSKVNRIDDNKKKVLLETDSVREAFEAVAYAKRNIDLFPRLLHTHSHRHTQFLRRVNK